MGLSFFQQIQKRNRDFEITIDGTLYPVSVVENERARRLTLRILPGGNGLKITAPPFIGDDELQAFAERNRNWAAVRFARLPQANPLLTGSVIPFKGEDHRIIFTGKMRGRVEISTEDGQPVICVPGPQENAPAKLLSWLKRQARRELDFCVARHAASIAVRPKRIRITDTTSRWGSCSTTRTLSFSWRIIMAPPEVLDYLAAHEVAHLKEMNHSQRFWDLTRQLCPHTDTSKAWLRRNGATLHAVVV